MKRKEVAKVAKADPTKLVLGAKEGETAEQAIARQLLLPQVRAGLTTHSYIRGLGEVSVTELVHELATQVKAVNAGDMKRSEAMLISQAHTLDAIFNEMARRAALNMSEFLPATDTYMRLALKAQSQCRATLETLAEIKNPPVVFAKQANISNGPQQINNGVAQAAKTEITQSKLLEHANGERLDTGATGTASGVDQALETVGAINGAEVH